ncbi:MAG TPA: hypothetical protein V6C82_06795 [Chroococcales cyanobacterium]
MEKKSTTKKSEKKPARRIDGVGFFHEFNPGQTQLLFELARDFADDLLIETVFKSVIPNCRFEADFPELEGYVAFELEQLKIRQESLEKLLS